MSCLLLKHALNSSYDDRVDHAYDVEAHYSIPCVAVHGSKPRLWVCLMVTSYRRKLIFFGIVDTEYVVAACRLVYASCSNYSLECNVCWACRVLY